MEKGTKTWIALIVLVIIIIGGIYIYKNINQPTATEDFAKCLASKSTVYSSSVCSHCQEQKSIIGPNYKFLNEIDCYSTPKKCIDANITATPTWIINGKEYVGVQSLSQLEQYSGCQCNINPTDSTNSSCTTNTTQPAECSINSTTCGK